MQMCLHACVRVCVICQWSIVCSFQGYFNNLQNITLTGRGNAGSIAAGARFGSAIESMGDVNMDGFIGKCIRMDEP